MIIKPIHDFKLFRSQLPNDEKNLVDGMIYDMANMAYKIQELKLSVDEHFIQFYLKSGKVLQFMVDDEFLYLMLVPLPKLKL